MQMIADETPPTRKCLYDKNKFIDDVKCVMLSILILHYIKSSVYHTENSGVSE